jgi:hypothetical protein
VPSPLDTVAIRAAQDSSVGSQPIGQSDASRRMHSPLTGSRAGSTGLCSAASTACATSGGGRLQQPPTPPQPLPSSCCASVQGEGPHTLLGLPCRHCGSVLPHDQVACLRRHALMTTATAGVLSAVLVAGSRSPTPDTAEQAGPAPSTGGSQDGGPCCANSGPVAADACLAGCPPPQQPLMQRSGHSLLADKGRARHTGSTSRRTRQLFSTLKSLGRHLLACFRAPAALV